MRARFALPLGIGLVLLAFGATLAEPSDEVTGAPFAVTGGLGDQLVSQHHVVTFRDAQFADEVALDRWEGTTSGVWLVVDATVEARVERMTVGVDVFVDGVRYAASDRSGGDTVDGSVADPGLPQTGPLLIELPSDIRERPGARSAVLRLGASGDTRLDSVIELRLDLTALDRVDRLEVEPTRDGDA